MTGSVTERKKESRDPAVLLFKKVFGFHTLFRRIVIFNFVGLLVIIIGVLYSDQSQKSLLDARIESLKTQGIILAGAIGTLANMNAGEFIDLNEAELEVLQRFANELDVEIAKQDQPLRFVVEPSDVSRVFSRTIANTDVRGRVYDQSGFLIADSQDLEEINDIFSIDNSTQTNAQPAPDWLDRILVHAFRFANYSIYSEVAYDQGKLYSEVVDSINGKISSIERVDENGSLIVSVALPIESDDGIIGSLLLSTRAGDIDQILKSERLAILQVFLIDLLVVFALSLLMTRTIAAPLSQLLAAAREVRSNIATRATIPSFQNRKDEVGQLAGALHEMTEALHERIDAISAFAADVAHELKNPLSSIRSAFETLPLAKNEEDQKQLNTVIMHDLRRLNRLISDISEASRVDADLLKTRLVPIDLNTMLSENGEYRGRILAGLQRPVRVKLNLPRNPTTILGNIDRIAQVLTNLLENASSFSRPEDEILINVQKSSKKVHIVIDDCGPGIHVNPIERIFDRFFTDRPDEYFGQNSGLGLSICRQIIELHNGQISAQNRIEHGEDGETVIVGARFIVSLPLMNGQSAF